MTIDLVSVRYIVGDVDAAVSVYTSHLGFAVGSTMAPAFPTSRSNPCGGIVRRGATMLPLVQSVTPLL